MRELSGQVICSVNTEVGVLLNTAKDLNQTPQSTTKDPKTLTLI